MHVVKAIFGTGGFGREVMQIAKRDLPLGHELIFVEDKPSRGEVNGVLVMSTDEFMAIRSEKFFNVCVGEPKARVQIANRLWDAGAEPFNIVSDRASIVHPVLLGNGIVILDGARISCNSKIGDHCHINYNTIIGHDCELNSFVTVGPGADINGWVYVARGAYIGGNACIKNGSEKERMHIGRNAVIGMGAVVVRDVPNDCIVMGNPARITRFIGESVGAEQWIK